MTEIEVIPPCGREPVFEAKAEVLPNETLGAFTLKAFENGGLEFIGSERGINSIQGSPVGMDAMEIISRQEMRSYGWCFLLNGIRPEAYADEIFLPAGKNKITWFFSYAHYLRGEWLSMCNPAWELKPGFLCGKK